MCIRDRHTGIILKFLHISVMKIKIHRFARKSLFISCNRTRDTGNLSQHIVNIHEKYLRRICAEGEFQGLKYHGGPTAKCQCKEEGVLRILDHVSFTKEENDHTAPEEPNTARFVIDCDDCLTSQNVEDLLQLQVSFWTTL